MKLSAKRILVAGSKTLGVITLLCMTAFFFMAMKARKFSDDLWKQLGIQESMAHQNIRNSFMYGDFYYSAKNAKNIAVGDRAAVIRELVAYAKKYYSGPEFTKDYQATRQRAMPREPKPPSISFESIKESEKQRLERNLKTAEQNLNSDNPKIKNSAPTAIEKIKKELAALDDPNNPTIKRQLDASAKSYEAAVKRYQSDLKDFEEKYPADYKVTLKKRLQQVLEISSTVDYNAELTERFNKKVFVNPEYEKKPKSWKLAYRAGKETTDLVRAEAEKWLKEL
ncbi:MAG TPA: hypothetical protein VGC29_11770 [Flavisolibacter sp.]